MGAILTWVVLGLCIAAVFAGIRQIRKINRERAETAAEIERLRAEWWREFEQTRSSTRTPPAKAESASLRVVK